MTIDPAIFGLMSIVKIGLVLLLGLFILFLVVVVVQVRTMNRLINQTFVSTALFVISILLLLAAISLFLASIVIL